MSFYRFCCGLSASAGILIYVTAALAVSENHDRWRANRFNEATQSWSTDQVHGWYLQGARQLRSLSSRSTKAEAQDATSLFKPLQIHARTSDGSEYDNLLAALSYGFVHGHSWVLRLRQWASTNMTTGAISPLERSIWFDVLLLTTEKDLIPLARELLARNKDATQQDSEQLHFIYRTLSSHDPTNADTILALSRYGPFLEPQAFTLEVMDRVLVHLNSVDELQREKILAQYWQTFEEQMQGFFEPSEKSRMQATLIMVYGSQLLQLTQSSRQRQFRDWTPVTQRKILAHWEQLRQRCDLFIKNP